MANANDQPPAAAAAIILQEYLGTLAAICEKPESRRKTIELLRAYAELRFRLVGGSHCSICNTHVRHVLPISSERLDGSTKEFDCLCTRCFEGERSVSKAVYVRAGRSTIDFQTGETRVDGNPHPEHLRPERIIY